MASGKRLPNESFADYKARMKTEGRIDRMRMRPQDFGRVVYDRELRNKQEPELDREAKILIAALSERTGYGYKDLAWAYLEVPENDRAAKRSEVAEMIARIDRGDYNA
jgi:hypothetical protein